jgi:hypothetical protein
VRRGEDVVGDHHDRLAHVVDGVAQEAEQLASRARVEVAGRLVGKDDLGVAEQRPGRGHPLLLTARELIGTMAEATGQAGHLHHLVDPAHVGLATGDGKREHDVVERCERRHQVE